MIKSYLKVWFWKEERSGEGEIERSGDSKDGNGEGRNGRKEERSKEKDRNGALSCTPGLAREELKQGCKLRPSSQEALDSEAHVSEQQIDNVTLSTPCPCILPLLMTSPKEAHLGPINKKEMEMKKTKTKNKKHLLLCV